jgi:hypothetical protein
MPVFDFTWSSGGTSNDPSDLEIFGPLVLVEIGIPVELEQARVRLGKEIPSPKVGYAMFDSGASRSAVTESIFRDLEIPPMDSISMSSTHGSGKSSVYPAKISFPALAINDFTMLKGLVGCNLSFKGTDGKETPWKAKDGRDVIMLIGRDILAGMLFIYNGPTATVTVGF